MNPTTTAYEGTNNNIVPVIFHNSCVKIRSTSVIKIIRAIKVYPCLSIYIYPISKTFGIYTQGQVP
jgi:hypothetical protein